MTMVPLFHPLLEALVPAALYVHWARPLHWYGPPILNTEIPWLSEVSFSINKVDWVFLVSEVEDCGTDSVSSVFLLPIQISSWLQELLDSEPYLLIVNRFLRIMHTW